MTSTGLTNYIPLKEAAAKYGLPEESLLDQVKAGEIGAGQLPNGDILVAEEDVDPSLQIRREDFETLRGTGISASAAKRKYDIDNSTFGKWAKAGYIRVLERGWQVMLDEADVAYCAAVYKAKARVYGGRMTGVPYLTKMGTRIGSNTRL